MSWSKRIDDNQRLIVQTFRDLGAKVAITSSAGGGFPDLVVQYRYPQDGKLDTMLVEVKDGSKSPSRRRLTPEQERFHAEFICHVVESVKDVFELLQVNYRD